MVRQEVKISAGKSGFIGRIWLAEQAASWIQFLNEGGGDCEVRFCFWKIKNIIERCNTLIKKIY